MDNAPLAPALTEQECQYLYEQRESYAFKLFAKVVAHQYSISAALLATAPREEIDTLRGELRGLVRARNILCYGKEPDPVLKPKNTV